MNDVMRNERVSQSDALHAGLIAGVIAGLAMAMVSMMMAMMTGEGFWAPVKKISVTLLSQSAVQEPGFQFIPVLVGMMIHFATAIAFGFIFALLALLSRGRSYGATVGVGIAYGLAIWVVMQFLVLPVVNPVMAQMPPLQFAMLHVIFGGTLGSYPAFLPSVKKSQTQGMRASRVA